MSTSDEDVQELAKKREAVALRQNFNDIKLALQHDYVRRVLWRIISMCGIYTKFFNNNGWTPYFEGKREIGLDILHMIEEADPDYLPKMMMDDTKKQVFQETLNKQEEESDD